MIRFFHDLTPDEAPRAGGKGRALAELAQAGLPVPQGFVILTDAFTGEALREEAWAEVQVALAAMRARAPGIAFAVRSSAIGEDSAERSFAGAFESALDLRDDPSVRRAIEAVRASGSAARVDAYSEAQGVEAPREVAVVVQELVRAELSGVLFTADPVSGSARAMVGNFVRGLGDKLVSGEVNAAAFRLARPSGKLEIEGEIAADLVAVFEREIAPVARALFRLGEQVERLRGGPQDIEWAVTRGEVTLGPPRPARRLAPLLGAILDAPAVRALLSARPKVVLLQARPITTLRGEDPATGEYNDSHLGDYLWTRGNIGEAVPDVMTPCTWSLLRWFLREAMAALYGFPAPPLGNIGGRIYMNLSVSATIAWSLGLTARLERASEQVFGRVPEGMTAPRLPMTRLEVLEVLVPNIARLRRRMRAHRGQFAGFIASAPARAEVLGARIAAAKSGASLLALFREEVAPYVTTCCQMLESGARGDGTVLVKVRGELEALVGEEDANALLTGLHGEGNGLASLGPLLGLEQLARGEIDREAYMQRHGHRGPHEFEISRPRLSEDPALIERELEAMRALQGGAASLLDRQRAAREAAWARLAARYPRRERALRRRIASASAAARAREEARSEVIRAFGVLRRYVLRAAALLGLGDEVFFLEIEEIQAALAGGSLPDPARIEARRAMFARYEALPPYPALVRGRFDPFQWAADPARRADVFDASAATAKSSGAASARGVITGFAGASGVVEGRARVLSAFDQGFSLEAGEVLVTTATNVGWTPLFPRASAIVTDVGAPLSHAAIVARELGIPAVVGCGDATSRIRTGDRLRVDGGRGTVEVLARAAPSEATAPGAAPEQEAEGEPG